MFSRFLLNLSGNIGSAGWTQSEAQPLVFCSCRPAPWSAGILDRPSLQNGSAIFLGCLVWLALPGHTSVWAGWSSGLFCCWFGSSSHWSPTCSEDFLHLRLNLSRPWGPEAAAPSTTLHTEPPTHQRPGFYDFFHLHARHQVLIIGLLRALLFQPCFTSSNEANSKLVCVLWWAGPL